MVSKQKVLPSITGIVESAKYSFMCIFTMSQARVVTCTITFKQARVKTPCSLVEIVKAQRIMVQRELVTKNGSTELAVSCDVLYSASGWGIRDVQTPDCAVVPEQSA